MVHIPLLAPAHSPQGGEPLAGAAPAKSQPSRPTRPGSPGETQTRHSQLWPRGNAPWVQGGVVGRTALLRALGSFWLVEAGPGLSRTARPSSTAGTLRALEPHRPELQHCGPADNCGSITSLPAASVSSSVKGVCFHFGSS